MPSPTTLLSGENDATVGAVGAVASSVNTSEAEPVFPAASVSLATSVCAPLARPVGVYDHAPLALAMVVPSTLEPSLIVTTALASPVPLSAAFDVILSVDDEPVSLVRPAVTVGAVASSVNTSEAEPVFPAASVSLATSVCAPLA